MTNTPGQLDPVSIELARRFHDLLAERPAGWATGTEHYQTYGYIVVLRDQLWSVVYPGKDPLPHPDNYRHALDPKFPDGKALLLAQQVSMAFDQAGTDHPPPGGGLVKLAKDLLQQVEKVLGKPGTAS